MSQLLLHYPVTVIKLQDRQLLSLQALKYPFEVRLP